MNNYDTEAGFFENEFNEETILDVVRKRILEGYPHIPKDFVFKDQNSKTIEKSAEAKTPIKSCLVVKDDLLSVLVTSLLLVTFKDANGTVLFTLDLEANNSVQDVRRVICSRIKEKEPMYFMKKIKQRFFPIALDKESSLKVSEILITHENTNDIYVRN